MELSNGFTGISGRRTLEDALVSIAQNTKAPQSLLIKLAKKQGASGSLALAVASNPNAPEEVFDGIEAELNHIEREKLARIPELPKSLLDRLAGDADFDVRCAVAAHLKTSIDIQKLIESDENAPANKRELVINPKTHGAILQRFVDDPDCLFAKV
ncbi:hypothetical protein CXF85_07705 [Colwellia sp. 75C3]|uniref:hypothetical protein n=1 Tax=Colwellia sp. 75C3 TaxID=888425 RepID=UPI000C34393B|nr:hypothetical protein [Colwellia sp. 75C3]PKG85453.1 hypothetical protein CXF85_07705 [Colwellia sp. 75C3]